MSNTINTTTIKSTDELRNDFRKAISAMNKVLLAEAAGEAVLSKDSKAAMSAMNAAKDAYNESALIDLYNSFLATDAPLVELCKVQEHSTGYAKRMTKAITLEFAVRNGIRINMLDFFRHAEKVGTPIEEAGYIIDGLKALAPKINDVILAESNGLPKATREKCINEARNCLFKEVLSKCGIEGLRARDNDVKALAMALAKAKARLEWDGVSADGIAPLLMDIIHSQVTGEQWKLRTANASKKTTK